MKKNLEKKIEEVKKKPVSKPFLVRFSPEELEAIQVEADRQGLSMNAMIRIATRDMLDNLKKKTG